MTGTKRSSEGLDVRRRKLLFRSWHRGMRELDLVLGTFIDSEVGALTETEIDQYELLLDVPDQQLLSWITGEQSIPAEQKTQLLERVIAFRGAMSFQQ